MGKTWEWSEIVAVCFFMTSVCLILPLIIKYKGFEDAVTVGLIPTFLGPWLYGIPPTNHIHIFIYFLISPLLLMNYVKFSTINKILLLMGFVLFGFHLERMKKSLEDMDILGKGDQWSLNFVFTMSITFLLTVYTYSYLHITHRDILLRHILENSEEIKNIFKAKERFFGCVSHELRNPLNVISNSLDLLLLKDMNNEHLKMCKICSMSLIYQITNILDFNQIQKNSLIIEQGEITPFNDMMHEIEPTFCLLTEGKDIKFQIIRTNCIPDYLVLNKEKMQQIIYNVVNNACSMNDGGTIFVRLNWHEYAGESGQLENILDQSSRTNLVEGVEEFISPVQSPHINYFEDINLCLEGKNQIHHNRIMTNRFFKIPQLKSEDLISEERKEMSGHEPMVAERYLSENIIESPVFEKEGEGYLQIEIIDTGRGVSESMANEFNRGNSYMFGIDTLPVSSLGLFIARELCCSMKGGMKIDSENNFGCSVNIAILVDVPSLRQIMYKGNFKSCFGMRVLYVEDQPFCQSIIKSILELEGISVTLADNGLQGLNKYIANSEQFEAIISDLRMPIMDGREMLTKIRNFESRQNKLPIPIIILSGDPSDIEMKKCKEAGANEFINKPTTGKKLLDALLKVQLLSHK